MTPFERAIIDAVCRAVTHSQSHTFFTCFTDLAVHIITVNDNWIPVRLPPGSYPLLNGISLLRKRGTKYSGTHRADTILGLTP